MKISRGKRPASSSAAFGAISRWANVPAEGERRSPPLRGQLDAHRLRVAVGHGVGLALFGHWRSGPGWGGLPPSLRWTEGARSRVSEAADLRHAL